MLIMLLSIALFACFIDWHPDYSKCIDISYCDFELVIDVTSSVFDGERQETLTITLKNRSGRDLDLLTSGDFFIIRMPGTFFDEQVFTMPKRYKHFETNGHIMEERSLGWFWFQSGKYELTVHANFYVRNNLETQRFSIRSNTINIIVECLE